jgi:hypothetical protein
MGNLQVRFLEGWAPAMAPGYSTLTGLRKVCSSSAQNRNNSGKRISTTLHGSYCLDRCLLRLVLVNNRL